MASILKSDSISKGTEHATPTVFNVEDVQSRARSYLTEVQNQADELIQLARQQAAAIRQEAKIQGLEDAKNEFDRRVEAEAQKVSDRRCRTAIESCQSVVANLTKESAGWLTMWRDQTVDLAARIADKLVRREMASDQELLRVWLEEALVAMHDLRDIRLLVHPDDFSVAGRFLQNLAKSIPNAAAVEIVPDPQVMLGGCIVRSNHGEVDQQLETQLQRLVEQLK